MTEEYRHIPVLAKECIENLDLHPGDVFVDATLGFGGHSSLAESEIGNSGLLIGLDQDAFALESAKMRLEKMEAEKRPILCLLHGNFGDFDELLLKALVPGVDAVLFDLGMSSAQIDDAERGFSFKQNAPLDMRMDPDRQSMTAADVIAEYDEAQLARILRDNSDEKWASRIAKFICDAREKEPIETSDRLVEIVKTAIPASARRRGGHPAKRTFQAIRMEVNHEQEVLRNGLDAAVRWLNPGGRICVISYHSIEDRIVKETFNSFADRCTCPPDLPMCVCGKMPILNVVTKKPITPAPAEVEENPRARSAKLRVAQKL